MKIAKLLIVFMAIVLIGGCKTENGDGKNPEKGKRVEKPGSSALTVVETPEAIVEKMKARGEQDKAEPELTVESPKENEEIRSSTVAVKVRVSGNVKQGKDEKGTGNHVHVILDNQPYAAHYMWDEGFELRNVTDGEHTLRMFASRPWHESYKNENAFKTIRFTVKNGNADETKPTTDSNGNTMAKPKSEQKEKAEGIDVKESSAGPVDFTKPLLTYSRPKGEYKGKNSKAIMIDFWLANAKLSGDGGKYRVRYSINDSEAKFVDKWEPFWLSGWKPGIHSIRLELVDSEGNLVENGGYNSTTRKITVSE